MKNLPEQKNCDYGVIFDFDNTILETEPLAEKLLLEILDGYNITITTEERKWMVGRSWAEIYSTLFVPRKFPLSINELADRIIEKKDKALKEHLPLLPGAKEAVLSVAKQFPVAIVTGSYRRELESALSLIGMRSALRGYVAAEDVTRGKPDPEPYLKGCHIIGLPPGSIVVFEDSEPGVLSAKAAGCYCVGVLAGALNSGGFRSADRIIDTLEVVNPEFIVDCLALDKKSPTGSIRVESQAPGTVLVIDDDTIIRELCSIHIGTLGYDVITAIDGQMALETFTKNIESIGLLVIDLTLPDIRGTELIKKMRSIRPDVPVVIISGYSSDEIVPELDGLSDVLFLPKPFMKKDIQNAVKKALQISS